MLYIYFISLDIIENTLDKNDPIWHYQEFSFNPFFILVLFYFRKGNSSQKITCQTYAPYRSHMTNQMSLAKLFVFFRKGKVWLHSRLGGYRRNFLLKMNYSCIGIKLCDGPAYFFKVDSPLYWGLLIVN